MKYDFYKIFKPTEKDWDERDQAYKRFCKRYNFKYKPLKRDPVYPERTLPDGSMDKEIIDKIIEEINAWIAVSAREYKVRGATVWYKRTVDRIIGMIRVLSIITNKEWSFDEKGLKEV